MTAGPATPIFRIFDEDLAREFYVGFLEFEVEFEHRFEDDLPLYLGLIPTVIDQNPCAHLRMPRDMIFHGWSMRLFQAWQHSATMSS